MRPLRDQRDETNTCAETAREARLLRAVSPLAPSLSRMHRVRLRIEATPEASFALSPRRALLAGGVMALAVVALLQQRVLLSEVASRAEPQLAPHHQGAAVRAATSTPAATVAREVKRAASAAAAASAAIESGAASAAATPIASPDAPAATGTLPAPATGAAAAPAEAVGVAARVAPVEGAAARAGQPPAEVTGAALAGAAPLVLPASGAAQQLTGSVGGTLAGGDPGTTSGALGGASAPSATPAVVAAGAAAIGGVGTGGGGGGASPASPTPPAPGIRRETPSSNRGGPRFEPALLAQAATVNPLGGDRAVFYSGVLDGRAVSGSVALRRDDDGAHALVIRHGIETVAEATLLEVGPASNLVVDLDGDGLDDLRITLRPPAESDDSGLTATDTSAFVPEVGVLLRAVP